MAQSIKQSGMQLGNTGSWVEGAPSLPQRSASHRRERIGRGAPPVERRPVWAWQREEEGAALQVANTLLSCCQRGSIKNTNAWPWLNLLTDPHLVLRMPGPYAPTFCLPSIHRHAPQIPAATLQLRSHRLLCQVLEISRDAEGQDVLTLLSDPSITMTIDEDGVQL